MEHHLAWLYVPDKYLLFTKELGRLEGWTKEFPPPPPPPPPPSSWKVNVDNGFDPLVSGTGVIVN